MVTDAVGFTLSGTASTATHFGVKLTAKKNCTLTSVAKRSGGNATTCELLNTSKVVLASSAYSSNVATFNYSLISGTSYYITSYKSGASYSFKYKEDAGVVYPVTGTNVDFIIGFQEDSIPEEISNGCYEIISVTTEDIATTTTKSAAWYKIKDLVKKTRKKDNSIMTFPREKRFNKITGQQISYEGVQ